MSQLNNNEPEIESPNLTAKQDLKRIVLVETGV